MLSSPTSAAKVIIAGAGGLSTRHGGISGPLPVIGVPVPSRLQGLDSLYSIVQMPAGIPVATVAIGNAKTLVSSANPRNPRPELLERVQQYRQSLAESVMEKQSKLEDQLGSPALLRRTVVNILH